MQQDSGHSNRLLGHHRHLHIRTTGNSCSAHHLATPQIIGILGLRIIHLGIKELGINIHGSTSRIMKVDHELVSQDARQVDLQLRLEVILSRHVMQVSLPTVRGIPRLSAGKDDLLGFIGKLVPQCLLLRRQLLPGRKRYTC